METVNTWGSGPQGLIAWSSNASIAAHPGEFNLRNMSEYMPGLNYDELNSGNPWQEDVFGGIWVCPSNKINYKAMTESHHIGAGFIVMQYSYWARTDLWDAGKATHPKQLTAKSNQRKSNFII